MSRSLRMIGGCLAACVLVSCAARHGQSRQKSFDEVLATTQQALHDAEAQYGPEHPATGQAALNLAHLYTGLSPAKDPGRAESLYRRAMDTYVAHDPSSDQAALAMMLLADQLRVSRPDEAEALYKRLIAQRGDAARLPDGTEARCHLSGCYRLQGRYVEAEAIAREAVEFAERVWGPQDERVAEALNELGSGLLDQHRDADAEPVLRRALAIMERADSHGMVAPLEHLRALYHQQGRFVEEEGLQARKVQHVKSCRLCGGKHELMRALADHAETLQRLGRTKEADRRLGRADALADELNMPRLSVSFSGPQPAEVDKP